MVALEHRPLGSVKVNMPTRPHSPPLSACLVFTPRERLIPIIYALVDETYRL